MFFTIVKSNTTGTEADLPGFHLGDWVAYVISLSAAGSEYGVQCAARAKDTGKRNRTDITDIQSAQTGTDIDVRPIANNRADSFHHFVY